METNQQAPSVVWPSPGATQPNRSNSLPVSKLAATLKERFEEGGRGDGSVHLFIEAEFNEKGGYNTSAPEGKDKVSPHEQAIAAIAKAEKCEVEVVGRYAHGVELIFRKV